MNSTILITPTTNIRNNTVVDESKIEKRICNTLMDVFTFRNVKQNEKRRENLMHVSLFDDVIVEGNTEYKILQMLSK